MAAQASTGNTSTKGRKAAPKTTEKVAGQQSTKAADKESLCMVDEISRWQEAKQAEAKMAAQRTKGHPRGEPLTWSVGGPKPWSGQINRKSRWRRRRPTRKGGADAD